MSSNQNQEGSAKSMKKWLSKVWQERICHRSTAGALGIALIVWYKWDIFGAMLDEYLRTPEFKGMVIGWFSSLLGYFFVKKG